MYQVEVSGKAGILLLPDADRLVTTSPASRLGSS
jgi:hypothetical protein